MFKALSSAGRVAFALAGFVTIAVGILATPASADVTQHQLTITMSGTGSGTVTSAPAGIDCAASCQANFDDGTDVVLTAVSAPGSWTVLWSGCDGLPFANQCLVHMNAPREVFASFGSDAAAPVDPNPALGPAPEDKAQQRKAEERARQQRALAKKRTKARAQCRKLQGKAKARCVRQANLIGKRTSSKRGT